MRKLTKNYFVRKGDAHVEALLISGDPLSQGSCGETKVASPLHRVRSLATMAIGSYATTTRLEDSRYFLLPYGYWIVVLEHNSAASAEIFGTVLYIGSYLVDITLPRGLYPAQVPYKFLYQYPCILKVE